MYTANTYTNVSKLSVVALQEALEQGVRGRRKMAIGQGVSFEMDEYDPPSGKSEDPVLVRQGVEISSV